MPMIRQKRRSKLLESGADLHAKDDSGLTALMWAAEGKAEIVHALLEAGADVNVMNKYCQTALKLAKE